jgi:hypothetical protein
VRWPWRAAHGGYGGSIATKTTRVGDCGGERLGERAQAMRRSEAMLWAWVIGLGCHAR